MKESIAKDAAGRLRQARERAGFKSKRSAALRFGWVPTTYASHENGQTPLPQDAAAVYAKAFKTSFVWLVTGENPGDDIVQIDGVISVGGSVHLLEAKKAPWIWLPFGVAAETIVLQVGDDSMSPRYDRGDIILCHDSADGIGGEKPEDVIGDEVVVVTAENVLFGRIRQGARAGTYDLERIKPPKIHNIEPWPAHRLFAVARRQAVSELFPGKTQAQAAARRN
jgi:hypothetical protein